MVLLVNYFESYTCDKVPALQEFGEKKVMLVVAIY
jgi:hypothetical protein